MRFRNRMCTVATIIFAASGGLRHPAIAAGTSRKAEAFEMRAAVERSLAFLTSDTVAWRAQHACSTCHHGVMTVWALNEAKHHGYDVADKQLTELVEWSRPFAVPDPSKPVATEGGAADVSTSALWFAATARSEPRLRSVTDDDLARIALHAAQRQSPDGSWWTKVEDVAYPPVYESREVMTLWAVLALPAPYPNDPPSPASDSRAKAMAWLARTKTTGTNQALALRLYLASVAGGSNRDRRSLIERLKRSQNRDGGWSALDTLPSDPFTTGEALYALGLAGLRPDERHVRRASAFLISTQRPDGSWVMTPRAAKLRPACENPGAISHIGSAWATLGLIQFSQSVRSQTAARTP